MENIESFTSLDADLGSQFICSKTINIQFSGEDLKNLLALKETQGINLQFGSDGNGSIKQYVTNEQFDTLHELLDIVLEGVCNYNLA